MPDKGELFMKNIWQKLLFLAVALLMLPVSALVVFSTDTAHVTQVTGLYARARALPHPPGSGTRVEVQIVNDSQQSFDSLRFQYFLDLSEVLNREFNVANVSVVAYKNEGRGVTQVTRW